MQQESGEPTDPRKAPWKTKVQLWVAVALMAVGFAGGFLARGIGSQPSAPTTGSGQTSTLPGGGAPGGAGELAPPLTEDQLNQGLPPGHPVVGTPNPVSSTSPKPSAKATPTR